MKIVALGVNSQTNKCCYIKSKATFEQLKQDFELYAKQYGANDWGGCCDIDFQTKYLGLKLTNEEFDYNGINCGVDYDYGHTDSYSFKFDKVIKVVPSNYKRKVRCGNCKTEGWEYNREFKCLNCGSNSNSYQILGEDILVEE